MARATSAVTAADKEYEDAKPEGTITKTAVAHELAWQNLCLAYQGSGFRRGVGSAGNINRLFSAMGVLAQVHTIQFFKMQIFSRCFLPPFSTQNLYKEARIPGHTSSGLGRAWLWHRACCFRPREGRCVPVLVRELDCPCTESPARRVALVSKPVRDSHMPRLRRALCLLLAELGETARAGPEFCCASKKQTT